MKNKEKYAKEIMEIACNGSRIAVMRGSGRIVPCDNILCSVCLFSADCRKNIKEWAESEYIEKPVISKKDRAFLEYIKEEFKYIARDKNDKLCVYNLKPYKSKNYSKWSTNNYDYLDLNYNVDFPMIKWSDEEPWLIEDLKKLEVVEECD